MGRRSNSGYIGDDFSQDAKGVIDLNKKTTIRINNSDLYYQDDASLFSGPAFETGSLNLLGSSGFGSGSIVSSSLVNGTLSTLTIYNGGSGYGTNATLSFANGGGTAANGYISTFSAGAASVVERLGYIKDIIITDPGEGYTSTPTMSVSAPVTANGVAGVTAIISASITGGTLTGYTIHNSGSNYRAGSNYPTITITGGGASRSASAVPVLEFGRNYTSVPTVTVTGGGTGAVVSASIVAPLSASGIITNAGGGYTSAPSIYIPSANSTVSASSTISAGAINTVTIVTGSELFDFPPAVNVGGELSYPALSDNQIYGTYAVYNNNSNWVAFNITTNGGGGYTVDWGDGTTNNYNTNVTSSHQYTTSSFNTLSSSLYDGAKLTQIKVTLSGSATSFATVTFTTVPTPTTGSFNPASTTIPNQWLSIAMAGSNVTSLILANSASPASSTFLEKFYYSGSNKITSFASMFTSCYSLTEVTDLFMGSGSSYTSMFSTCTKLKKLPIINVNNATDLTSMFSGCSNLETVTFASASNVTNWSNTFQNCYNLLNINNDNFSTTTIGGLQNTFNNCNKLRSLPPINVTNVNSLNGTFSGCYNLTSIKFIGNTSRVINFTSTFANCYSLIDIPRTLDCRSTTSITSLFSSCYSLKKSPRFTNTNNITNVSNLFASCYNLTEVSLFDTSNVNTFASMFGGCFSLTSIPKFNLRSGTTVSGMFTNCSNLKTIPLLNTANISTFTSMFAGCGSLISIPPINTSKGITFTTMFNSCVSLKTIPYLDTSNGTAMDSMFQGCTSLEEIPALNTSNATTLSAMFASANSLKRVPNFNIANCTTIANMFQNCAALKEAPLFYNANKLTTLATIFSGCNSLKRIPGMTGTVASTTLVATNMVASCFNLIEIGSIPTSGITTTTTMFANCRGLRRMQITNINATFDISNQNLDSVALNEVYTNLSATGTGKTITVTGNWGTANDNPTIATAKGWSVSG